MATHNTGLALATRERAEFAFRIVFDERPLSTSTPGTQRDAVIGVVGMRTWNELCKSFDYYSTKPENIREHAIKTLRGCLPVVGVIA